MATLLGITAFLGACWLLDAGYDVVSHASGWSLGISGGLLASLAVAGPTILRFVPVLKKPAVRKLVLLALLYIAGVIIPLGAVALFPLVALSAAGVANQFPFSGISLLIMVGVGLDTVKQIESQLQQRNYEGFLR